MQAEKMLAQLSLQRFTVRHMEAMVVGAVYDMPRSCHVDSSLFFGIVCKISPRAAHRRCGEQLVRFEFEITIKTSLFVQHLHLPPPS